MAEKKREAGIDFLKAFSISLVLVWHLKVFIMSTLSDQSSVDLLIKNIVAYAFHYFLMLSIPSFITISLYFFYRKLVQAPDYWKQRIFRLVQIYVFWVGIQFILYVILSGDYHLPLKTIFRSGGPDLPWLSSHVPSPSIFYYLYALLFCTVLAYLFFKLPEKIKLVVFVVVVAGSCIYFFIASASGWTIDTRSMRNWYVYVPIAYYLFRYQERFVRMRWFFLAGFLVAVLVEYLLGGMLTAFGRVSVFLETLMAMAFCMSGWGKISRPTALLSRYSLGLYALHPYWMGLVMVGFALLHGGPQAYPPRMLYEGVVMFFITLGLTFVSVWLISKTRLRMFVS